MAVKKKTPLQVRALEDLYSDEKYPTPKAMEECAVAIGLTLKQVRKWFSEKRRTDKAKNEAECLPCSSREPQAFRRKGEVGIFTKKINGRVLSVGSKGRGADSLPARHGIMSSVERRISKAMRGNRPICLQDMLFKPEYILQKVFRKDGPPLGIEFDSVPAKAFNVKSGSSNDVTLQDIFNQTRKRKIHDNPTVDIIEEPSRCPRKRHGMGKGLMTVWRATNPHGGAIPKGIDYVERGSLMCRRSAAWKPSFFKRPTRTEILAKQRRLKDKILEKKKRLRKRKEVQHNQDYLVKPLRKEKCELSLESHIYKEHNDQFTMRVEDEELELRELQAGPNPLSSCDHMASDTLLGCSLCKDLLPKFPPSTVETKKPFSAQHWGSSTDMVKKLFKAFHFLYTYSMMLDINSFTLDEFAQAFYDKDSVLLGQVHVALLELLFVDISLELSGGSFRHSSKSCKFLALLHSVEKQEIVVEFWKKFLNPLTWPEVLRQVSVAAGFGSNQSPFQREVVDEDLSSMKKYGLRPGTLKGELFRLLLQQGTNGLKVSEMARSPQLAEFAIPDSTEALEAVICSTLSSDIALFEKISSSTYRLRVNLSSQDDGDCESDTDSGTVDDQHDENGLCNSTDSECEPGSPSDRKSKNINNHQRRKNMLFVNGEIDESHPGEPWLLGLMEGEYSDLSIEEKLNALVSLIDLLSAGSSIRMEDPTKAVAAVPSVYSGSGGKIKRSSANQQTTTMPSWVYQSSDGWKTIQSLQDTRPVDSKEVISKLSTLGRSLGSKKGSDSNHIHPMQSIFLGSDRRYNMYWLFLGPCDECDPGHKRLYIESSEDGHWEVIDTEEAFSALLSVLDERGAREGCLIESLDKLKVFICQAMSTGDKNAKAVSVSSCRSELDLGSEANSSPISDVDNALNSLVAVGDSVPSQGAIVLENGKKKDEQKRRWSRLKAFDAWTWTSYLELNCVKLGKRSFMDSLVKCERCHDLYWRDEKHCKICHKTFELDFELDERYAVHAATCTQKEDADAFPSYKIFSSRLQSLKAALHTIESTMPEGSLIGAWSKSAHRLWVRRLRWTASVAELLQVLADFVGAINRDWLFQCNSMQNSDIVGEEIVALFPMIPRTSSAVALWLVKLDSLLANYAEVANLNTKVP